MMKLALLASTAVAAATAFAPAQTTGMRPATAVSETKADLEVLAKKLNPVLGFYDPLNLAEAEFWGYVLRGASLVGFAEVCIAYNTHIS